MSENHRNQIIGIFIISGVILASVIFFLFSYFFLIDDCNVGYGEDEENEGDLFLVKYNAFGDLLLSKSFGGILLEEGYDITIDEANNTYIVGYKIDFNSPSPHKLLVMKLNANATQLWNVTIRGVSWWENLKYCGIVVDNESNIYIACTTAGYGIGGGDVLILKFDTNGTQLWNTTWGGSAEDSGRDISIDSENHLYVVGSTKSFGAGSSDIVIIKYDSNGTQLWNTTIGSNDYDSSQGVTIDEANFIYIAANTPTGVLIMKFHSDGSQIWNTTLGGLNHATSNAITVDSENCTYITGITYSYSSWEDTYYEILVCKLDANGFPLWNSTWGEIYPNHDIGYDIAVDSNKNIYVIGTASNDILLKYNSIGELLWIRKSGGNQGYGIQIDASDDIYITGRNI